MEEQCYIEGCDLSFAVDRNWHSNLFYCQSLALVITKYCSKSSPSSPRQETVERTSGGDGNFSNYNCICSPCLFVIVLLLFMAWMPSVSLLLLVLLNKNLLILTMRIY